MLRSEHHVGGSEECIRSGGENGDLTALDIEGHFCAFRATDPVALECLDPFRPVEGFQLVDQALCVLRNTQHPLAQRTALDGVTFRFPLFDFLIGEDGAEIG